MDNIHKWSDKKNEMNEKAGKAIKELAKVNEPIKTLSIIAVGNPGVGKSLFLNILLGEHVFKSGISIGKGKCIFLENSLTYLLTHILVFFVVCKSWGSNTTTNKNM